MLAYVLRALNFAQVDGFHEPGSCRKNGGIQAATGSGDDLATTTVDSVSVKGDVVDVEANATHVLIAEHTFLGGPLEASDDGVLDFVKVLNT